MTAEEALEIARRKWGVGARVVLVAVGKPDVSDETREKARRELAEHEKRAPKLIQMDSAPPDMTMREYECHRRAWHSAYEKHRKHEDELRQLAFGFSMTVLRGGELYAEYSYRPERAHTWEDALKAAGIQTVDTLSVRVDNHLNKTTND